MALIDEINKKSKEIKTDSYGISISEIISMYNDGDIEIHPEFQRFYRWSDYQKTKLIESILLNIPIPPIFVSQREDGVWDVVDGLQRLSTIFQFVHVYKDINGDVTSPLKLEGTKLLPNLKDKVYDEKDDAHNHFSDVERRYFKRAKLNFEIILKGSDSSSKYELFQRLNTGGSSLSDQEVRNCLMVMTDNEKFEILCDMAKNSDFIETTSLSDKLVNERFDLELVTRFLCLRGLKTDELKNVQDFGEFLNEKIISIFNDENFDWKKEKEIFDNTFKFINSQLDKDAYCKYDLDKRKFVGKFYTGVYEIVAIGLGRHDGTHVENFNLRDKIIQLWNQISEDDISWKGYNAAGRLQKTLSLGDKLYG